MDSTKKEEACQEELLLPQPPAYCMDHGPGSAGSGDPCFQPDKYRSQRNPLPPSYSHSTRVLVEQENPPVFLRKKKPPSTTTTLVLSTLNAIFCGCTCGAIGICLTWKARLQVLDRKYEHARQTLCVARIFLALGLLSGAGMILYWLALYKMITSSSNGY